MKKIVLNLILFSVFSLFNGTFSADLTWKNYNSCIDFSSSLQTFLKNNKDLVQESGFSAPFFSDETSLSSTYTSLLQDHSILIIKNTAPNLTSTNLIARIKLPKSRKSIQHRILDGDLLLLSVQNQSWSQVLRYQIQNDKIKNIKNLTFSTPIQTISTMNQKLLILSQTWFTRNELSKLAKHQAVENLPTLNITENVLSTGLTLSPSCKDLQYQLLTGFSPKFTSISIFDLDAPEKAPELDYYLGNIDQLFFGQDYLFFAKNLKNQTFNCENCISSASGSQTTLLQRFTLEPRLHLTENALLSGNLLSFSQKSINTPNILLVQNSGNTKQLSLANFDAKFSKLATHQILARTQSNFSQLITGQNSLILANNDQSEILPLPASQSTPSISLDPKSDFLVHSSKGISLLHTSKISEGLTVELNPLTFSGTQTTMQISQIPSSPLLRNSDKKLLSFFSEKDNKPILHTYLITEEGQIKHHLSRNYSRLSQTPHFHLFSIVNDLAIIAFKEYLDLFALSSPTKTKLLKLK